MSSHLKEIENSTFLQTYKRLPIEIDKAESVFIYDKSGRQYLDFLGGIAVNVLGHSHPLIIDAVGKQIRRYMHVSNYFYQDAQIRFVSKLVGISGYDRAFLTNSGTEAIEGAIKFCRRWGFDSDKTEIIAFTGGFHGRTYGALSLMDKPHYKDKMGPFLDNMKIIEYNKIDELRKTINEKTAAVLLEFVQGEGGITTADTDWIDEIEKLRNKFDFLLIADEIQAGIGRTGDFFSFSRYNIKPDIVTLAKGLGGGLPLGCILTTERLSYVFEKGMHGTTFGGNAVSCAAGEIVLDELSNGLLSHVNETGKYLDEKLNQVKNKFPDKVLEVRGYGLMQGLLLSFDASLLVDELLKHGIITNAASGKVLRLVPPLIIKNEHIDTLAEGLINSLNI